MEKTKQTKKKMFFNKSASSALSWCLTFRQTTQKTRLDQAYSRYLQSSLYFGKPIFFRWGCIMLINSILSSLPTYWMSVFELPSWVRKEINWILRDFLWSCCNISKPKYRLTAWSHICKFKNQGGYGILDLTNFNLALLGKWWWKFYSCSNLVWSEIIAFNYMSKGDLISLLHSTPRKASFFWKGLLKCKAAFPVSI